MVGSGVLNIIQTFFWYQYYKTDDNGESRLNTVKALYVSIIDLLYKFALVLYIWTAMQESIDKAAKMHLPPTVVCVPFFLALLF